MREFLACIGAVLQRAISWPAFLAHRGRRHWRRRPELGKRTRDVYRLVWPGASGPATARWRTHQLDDDYRDTY